MKKALGIFIGTLIILVYLAVFTMLIGCLVVLNFLTISEWFDQQPFIHTCVPPDVQQIEFAKSRIYGCYGKFGGLVEPRGIEPLTSTMPL